MALYMAHDTEDDKPRELKLYFHKSEIAEIDEFRKKWTKLQSRNELFHVAIDYYMTQVLGSDGVVNRQGFPLIHAAEGRMPYEVRAHPVPKKKTPDHG